MEINKQYFPFSICRYERFYDSINMVKQLQGEQSVDFSRENVHIQVRKLGATLMPYRFLFNDSFNG